MTRDESEAKPTPSDARVRALTEALRDALDALYPVVVAKHGTSSAGHLTVADCDRELCAGYNRWRALAPTPTTTENRDA